MRGAMPGHEQPSEGTAAPPLSRREFLAKAGWVSFGAALLQLPGILRGRGWLDEAAAQSTDLTLDTMNGLIAFVVPGPDTYSVPVAKLTAGALSNKEIAQRLFVSLATVETHLSHAYDKLQITGRKAIRAALEDG